jgi:putative membrane protein insertion efficiency factor
MKAVNRILTNLSLKLIAFYKFAVAWKGRTCRFDPTCSQYAYEAIEKYGFIIGWKLAIKRIASCHPFHEGGHDPVP